MRGEDACVPHGAKATRTGRGQPPTGAEGPTSPPPQRVGRALRGQTATSPAKPAASPDTPEIDVSEPFPESTENALIAPAPLLSTYKNPSPSVTSRLTGPGAVASFVPVPTSESAPVEAIEGWM